MNKTTAAITIDADVLLWCRCNVDNLSGTINQFLKTLREQHDDNPTEQQRTELLKELKSIKKNLHDAATKQAIIESKIKKLDDDKEAEIKKQMDILEEETSSLKASGWLREYV